MSKGIDSRRIAHMKNSCKVIQILRDKVPGAHLEDLKTAARLHDIGYSNKINIDSDLPHEIRGAYYLKSLNFSDLICKLVANHGYGNKIPEEFKLNSDLEKYLSDIIKFSDISSTGHGLGSVNHRVLDVIKRSKRSEGDSGISKNFSIMGLLKLYYYYYKYYKVLIKLRAPIFWYRRQDRWQSVITQE